jgi:CRP-like cAMP-binding protein
MTQLQQATRKSASHNQLLATLTSADSDLIHAHFERVPLNFRDILIEARAPLEHVYFPEQGIASILANTSEGRIEVGMIGREGMVGVPVVLGLDRSPHAFLIQAAGEAQRISANDLRQVIARSPSLNARLLRYVHAMMIQTAQTAYANASFNIEARLARWILMTHDRVESDDLPLTHDFLSMMLGVRRPGVTVAVQTLEASGLIRASRGRITVLDRPKLEEVADDAYGLSEAEYASVMGQA